MLQSPSNQVCNGLLPDGISAIKRCAEGAASQEIKVEWEKFSGSEKHTLGEQSAGPREYGQVGRVNVYLKGSG